MEDSPVLMVGGGRSAAIKLRTILDYGLRVTIVACHISEEIKELITKHNICFYERAVMTDDFDGVGLVFAMADRATNQFVYHEAKKRHLLCATADGKGDFMLPAHRHQGNLTVTVSTNGKFPLLAKKICNNIDLSIASRLTQLEQYRLWVLQNIQDKTKCRAILAEIADNAEDDKKILACIGRNLNMSQTIKIGTRGSRLAIRQTELVRDELLQYFPELNIEIVTIKTKGDKILNQTLDKIGGKGVFVKEIEQALLDKKIDIAVHSLKDMPDEMHEELSLFAVLKRENPMDALICNKGLDLESLPEGAVIGTGSLRRKTQILQLRPDLKIEPIRGNIETRMKKMEESFDGVILAAAGLIRSGYQDRISHCFRLEEMIPAACQGILAVQGRKKDDSCKALLSLLNHCETDICQKAERAFLKGVGADCHAPAGALARIEESKLLMKAMFYADKMLVVEGQGQLENPEQLGTELANKIKSLISE